jgi:hypothetical protein
VLQDRTVSRTNLPLVSCQPLPAWSTSFQLPSAMKFMVLTQITLPIEPAGGRHVYSFRLDGSYERFDVPLDVVFQ